MGTRDRRFTRTIDDQRPEAVRKEKGTGYILEQALTLFVRVKEVENLRDKTIKVYFEHIGYLSDFMTEVKGFPQALLDDLDADLIREYIKCLMTEKQRYDGVSGSKDKTIGLPPTTINIRLRTLRTMCNFWYKEGIHKCDGEY